MGPGGFVRDRRQKLKARPISLKIRDSRVDQLERSQQRRESLLVHLHAMPQLNEHRRCAKRFVYQGTSGLQGLPVHILCPSKQPSNRVLALQLQHANDSV